MQKHAVCFTLALFLVSFTILALTWFLFNSDQQTIEIPIPLKVRQYYDEIIDNRSEERNIQLLSAFDFQDEFFTVSTAKMHLAGKSVYCHYFDKNRRPIPDASRQISLFTNTRARCPKLEKIDSNFIALSFSNRKSSQLVPIPIRKRQFFEKKHDLTVCVELELQVNWLEVTTFIEYHRNLNFSLFYFTSFNLDAYTRKVFDDYTRLGIVHLTSLRSSDNLTDPKVFDDFKNIQRNNCLLHAKSNSKFVTFLRIEERVLDIPFFIDSLSTENVTESRVVTKTIDPQNRLTEFTNETDIRKTLEDFKYKENVQFRRVIHPEGIEKIDEISEDFVYKKASSFSATLLESVKSSIISRTKYNYKTRPIYCDEFNIEILSWCPVNVYHCKFRNEENEKIIMEKREEAKKVRYIQGKMRW